MSPAGYRVIQREDPTAAIDEKPPKSNSIEKLPYALINTFIVIFTLSDQNRVVLLNQFLYHRLARDLAGNVSVDTTSHPCGDGSDLSTSDSDTSEVQQITSSMTMNFELVVSLLGVLGSLVLGTFSTSLGRKAQLLIPISGFTVRALSILAVAFWDLNLSWLYVGCVAEGLMGGCPGVYLGVFLYVSDITPRNRKRTLGLALLEGIRGIMGSGINIASGQMIQRTTFVVPASFTASGAIICAIMAMLMPNRMKKGTESLSSEKLKQPEKLSSDMVKISDNLSSAKSKQSENLSSRMVKQPGDLSSSIIKQSESLPSEMGKHSGRLSLENVQQCENMSRIVRQTENLSSEQVNMSQSLSSEMVKQSENVPSEQVKKSQSLSSEMVTQSDNSSSEQVKKSQGLSSETIKPPDNLSSEQVKKPQSLSSELVKKSENMSPEKPSKSMLVSAAVKRSWRVLVSPIHHLKEARLRRMVGVAAVAYFLGFSTVHSMDRVRLLYLMHRPFCWSAISIGWYQCIRQAIFNIAIITLVPMLHRCLPGVSLAVVGAVANITEYTLFAFARADIYLYIALATSFGQGLPLNMVRGETSRLFGPEEQGLWFACLAVLENISFSVGIFLMSVYTISLRFYVGLIFNVYALMTILMIIFLCIFQHNWLRFMKSMLHNEKIVHSPSAAIQVPSPQREVTLPHCEVPFPRRDVILLRCEVTLPRNKVVLPRFEGTFPRRGVTFLRPEVTSHPRRVVTLPRRVVTLPRRELDTSPKSQSLVEIDGISEDQCFMDTGKRISKAQVPVSNKT